MKRVVTVDLNGMSFNFDEDAYEGLRAYLRRAESQLATDPGRAEVIADLERSIAEKCHAFVQPTKNVISADELRSVLAQIGTVDARTDHEQAQTSGESFASAGDHRPLVQIREGAMISGVCAGLAARFGIDVTIVRVIFIVLAIATSGAFVLVYIAMMFLIPYDTNIEKVNDQSVPGFMFKFVTQMKRKVAG
jgi:phage shock protein PspC (stress-responsive transcriptional regulator)